ncbi:protein ABHD14B-like isoform X2 [Ischnura elegans]|uniref:protein ABHD14B-like isoform X2 n=1 Tax=Ischnura elegans TaxID=197161 RepID=UPI001ED8B026|nr:protein ABHD14B-like isoform X2 [Ischnura elegans]
MIHLWIKLCMLIGFVVVVTWLTVSGIVKSSDIDMAKDISAEEVNWRKVNFYEYSLPEEVLGIKEKVIIKSLRVNVLSIDVHYREAQCPEGVSTTGQSILLLHGQRFSSKTWEDLGTMYLMGALGHRVVAVDLPGFGETKTSYSGNRSSFLFELCSALGLLTPVIVSPSMSGSYSIPFLASHADKFSGFLPVAPVATEKVTKATLETVQVPTLILFGSNDHVEHAKKSKENLQIIPKSQLVIFEGAGHACYLDEPVKFHTILFNFLKLLRI